MHIWAYFLSNIRQEQGLIPKNKLSSLWKRLFEYKIKHKILKVQDLMDRRLFGIFKKFLYTLYADEYLEFWIEVGSYNSLTTKPPY